MTVLKIISRSFLFLILTILTQVGGVVYLISLLISAKWKFNFRGKQVILFSLLYAAVTFLIVPIIAPLFGRERVLNNNIISPSTYMTVLMNRNYIKPELNDLLVATALELANTEVKISYLDANFPFIDGFPLLPHLSHNDGKKIDLSLIYETKEGWLTQENKSISGYGVFVEPTQNEHNQNLVCKSAGYFQYDFPKLLTFGSINSDLQFSKIGTKNLMLTILSQPNLGKVFIEPHLKSRMKLSNNKIRFHGCGAVRHDDHIHIQLK